MASRSLSELQRLKAPEHRPGTLVLLAVLAAGVWVGVGITHFGAVGGLTVMTLMATLIAVHTWIRAARAEELVHQEGTRPGTVKRAAPEWITRFDADGRCTEASAGLAVRLGQRPDGLVGKMWDAFFHPEDRPTVERAFQLARQSGRAEAAARGVTDDGRSVPLRLVLQDIKDRVGAPMATWCFVRDASVREQRSMPGDETRAERVIAGTSAGIWDWNLYTNEFSVSPRFAAMLGVTAPQFGKHLDAWLSRLHPDDLDSVWRRIQQHLNGRAEYDTEYRLRTEAGEYRWFQSRGQAVWDDNGQPVRMSGSIFDVTERHSAEQQLRESEQRFRLFVQGVQDYAIVMLDSKGGITSWNAGAERIKGYAADEILGRHMSRFYPPEDTAKGVPDRDLVTAAEQGKLEIEGWRIRKDGSRLWASEVITAQRDDNGDLWGFASVTRDLTERRDTESKLQASVKGYENTNRELQFLKFALDQHAIVAITDARGRITYVNKRFCEISQFSREELLHQDHRIVNSGHHPKSFFKEMYVTIAAGNVWRGEICNRAKDGSLYWVDTTIVPAKDENDRISNYVAIRADITEKKGVQEAIAGAYELLGQQNEKLKALSDRAHNFVDDVSHEFRTPLAVIKEFVSIIADRLAGPVSQEQAEYLAILNNAVLDLNHLVDDFLDSSKLRAGRLRVDRQGHDVLRIFDGVRPMIARKASQQSMVFEEHIEPGLPRVFADEEKARRVVMNLAINAIKFSRGQGSVELWARGGEDGGVEIGVTDHGPGLTPQAMEHLFGRFQQFESAPAPGVKGFGLGLNIARQLVWLNLGVMRVHSQLGQGATFSFTLPPDEPAAVVAAFLGRLAECTETQLGIALLEIATQEFDVAEELPAFLSATTRPSDLLLRDPHSGACLLLGPTSSAKGWVERIREERASAEANSGELRIGIVGEWRNPDRLEAARSAALARVSMEQAHA